MRIKGETEMRKGGLVRKLERKRKCIQDGGQKMGKEKVRDK